MIYARRYYWADATPEDNMALLDGIVLHPGFLSYPTTPEEARVLAAGFLTHPDHLIWTTHNDKTLTGMVMLTRIVPQVDALVHFLSLDQNLAGKRKLLRNLHGYCFQDLGFHRLSMEVREGTHLERFARRALGYRLEGEIRARNPELPKCLDNIWTARQGARREQGHFDGSQWGDISLLRLLASEWVGEPGEVECRTTTPARNSPNAPAAGVKTPSARPPQTDSTPPHSRATSLPSTNSSIS